MSGNQNRTKRIEAIFLLTMLLLFLIFWDTYLVYPIKLFTVVFHEISHGLAAVLSGGTIVELSFNPDLSGGCITENGSHILIASAGYIGSSIVGAVLFLSTTNKAFNNTLSILLGSILIIITANFLKDEFEIIASLLTALFLILSPQFIRWDIQRLIMRLIGLTSCIYVLFDIKDDLFASEVRQTDAQLIYLLTGIPAFIWATLWLIISGVIIFFLFRKGYQTTIQSNG